MCRPDERGAFPLDQYLEALEFHIILRKLQEHALSRRAKDALAGLTPSLNEAVCRRTMAETTAARAVLDSLGSPPLALMNNLEENLSLAEVGGMLNPGQLTGIARFAASCKRLAAYLQKGEAIGPQIAVYGRNIADLSGLREAIESRVSEERVYDEASAELRGVRRKMDWVQAQIKDKLSRILQSRKQYLADSYISVRNGHYVLPVQRKYQNQFGGTVIELSGKGATVFMEPSAIRELQAEWTELSIREDAEVRRVLYGLTAEVAANARVIRAGMEAMEVLDVLFAKAKFSAALHARAVEICAGRQIRILRGRHPLLSADDCVPLDFEMADGISGVVITGPNTGGKTVTIKTVGLLSAMAQCGLHIPCAEGTRIAMRDAYFCDIGDGQSISQNLSTFSGHITNVIGILNGASRDSLVLLDELGSGTDPAEGMGIAVAVLEELRLRGCIFLVTTHYPQVKAYAEQAEGVASARMAFDRESLRPLYRLEMGKSGESCALSIAERLGMAPHLLERARRAVYGGDAPAGPASGGAPAPVSRLVRTAPVSNAARPGGKFSMGDSVVVLPSRETGIVYQPADDKGDVMVQVKGEKRRIRHNRLLLRVSAAELYPPDYDFSILFDTVADRKARRILSKRYDPSVSITRLPGGEEPSRG